MQIRIHDSSYTENNTNKMLFNLCLALNPFMKNKNVQRPIQSDLSKSL